MKTTFEVETEKVSRINRTTHFGMVITDDEDIVREQLRDESKTVGQKLMSGNNPISVLNFHILTYDSKEKQYYKLPVCVWDKELIELCENQMVKNSMVYIEGELRIKTIYDHHSGKQKQYTTIKCSHLQILEAFDSNTRKRMTLNQIILNGRIVDVVDEENSYKLKIEVPRLLHRNVIGKTEQTTDQIPVTMKRISYLKEPNIGDSVFVKGRIKTREKCDNNPLDRIYVDCEQIIYT